MLVCLGSCDQLHSRFKDTTGQQHSCTLSFHVNTFQIIICAVVLYALFVFIRHLLYRLLWIYSISSYMYIFLKIFICVCSIVLDTVWKPRGLREMQKTILVSVFHWTCSFNKYFKNKENQRTKTKDRRKQPMCLMTESSLCEITFDKTIRQVKGTKAPN